MPNSYQEWCEYQERMERRLSESRSMLEKFQEELAESRSMLAKAQEELAETKKVLEGLMRSRT